MKSYLAASTVLAVFLLVGCGERTPTLAPSEVGDPAEDFATAIKAEAMALIETANTDPEGIADAAEVLLESLEDISAAGQYSDTIGQIKEKVSALASGSGNASELAELVAKLPGGDEGEGEPAQE
jgi:hypothetical protein